MFSRCFQSTQSSPQQVCNKRGGAKKQKTKQNTFPSEKDHGFEKHVHRRVRQIGLPLAPILHISPFCFQVMSAYKELEREREKLKV